ncbi:zinc finger protein 830 [Tanacetum coccineum]
MTSLPLPKLEEAYIVLTLYRFHETTKNIIYENSDRDEYKEFEKLIQEDLKEVDNRLEEEEYDAAEMIEEAETVEQKSCRERVELFKRKKLELKAARSGKRNKVSQVVEKESSSDESSSDEDSDDAVDWRAKHL